MLQKAFRQSMKEEKEDDDLPVEASLKNSDMIASMPRQSKLSNSSLLDVNSVFSPIRAKITVSNGAAGKTIGALCSIIRRRSTEKERTNERDLFLVDEMIVH